jgi:hypothetical protein
MTLTGFVVALALCAVVIVAQILASAFGAVDPSAAF